MKVIYFRVKISLQASKTYVLKNPRKILWGQAEENYAESHFVY
jgi:hypothetical protein